MQGSPRSLCQQTQLEKPANPGPRLGPVHQWHQPGKRLSGYAVVTEETIIEAGSLPSQGSAQRADLHALIWALQLSKGKKMNIYTDSRYAFATLHIFGALFKGRGLLMANGKDTKGKEETLTLLDAVWEPEKVVVMHCQGHQREDTPPHPKHGETD